MISLNDKNEVGGIFDHYNHKKHDKQGNPKKKKIPSTKKISPKYVQIEACLWLGCERISQNSYSKPHIFGQTVDFGEDEIFFLAKTD